MKLKTLLFLVFFYGILSAQNICIVVDLNNNPIQDVIIFGNENTHSVTDENGTFVKSQFYSCDSVSFSHLSYQTLVISKSKLKKSKNIILTDKELIQKEVEILGNNTAREKIVQNQSIKINASELSAFSDAGDILKIKSNLQVKDYGGSGSSKTVSSRGMSSENTIVLFNNVKVTDLRSGIFDFSKISSLAIDKIEVVKNSDLESTHSAAGGVIKLFSGNSLNENKFILNTSFDQWGKQNYAVKYKKSDKKFSAAISGERGFSKNQYDFSFEGEDYKRKNAHYSKSFLSADFNYKSKIFVINSYSHYSYFKNGIPGFVVTNNVAGSKAENETNSFLSIVNLNYLFSARTSIKTTLSYQKQQSVYTDPDYSLFFKDVRRESKMNNVSATSSIKNKFEILTLNYGFKFNYSDISGMNYLELPNKTDLNLRSSYKIFTSAIYSLAENLSWVKSLDVSFYGNYEFLNERTNNKNKSELLSYNIGLAFQPAGINNFLFTAHFFDEKRNPSLNEKYYANLFLPSILKPEEYNGIDAGLSYNSKDIILSLTGFIISGKDKIIWLPGRMGIYKPINAGKVKTTGIEFQLIKKYFEKKVLLNFNYNFTDARNKEKNGSDNSSYNKLLRYTPQHRFNLSATIKFKNLFKGIPEIFDGLQTSLFYHFESERFYATDNNSRSKLKHFSVIDLNIHYRFNILNIENSIGLNIYNLLNKEYFIVQSYPMPLRNYTITYTMEL